jgi:hypothetical protein
MKLDEKAIQAVSQWKFEPAQKGGKPVAVPIEVEVSFYLDRSGGSKQMFSAKQYQQMREARSRIQSQIHRTSGGEEPLVLSSIRFGPIGTSGHCCRVDF